MVIERRDFLPFVRDQPDIAIKLIEILCGRLRQTSEQVEEVMFLGLEPRLAKAVVRLGKFDRIAAKPATFAITQRELSQMIGMSRESTNKQLRAWEKRKWVRLGRGTLTVLNPEALVEISEEGGNFE